MPEMTAYETECRKRCEWCFVSVPINGRHQVNQSNSGVGDEALYTPDSGDCGMHLIGPECARIVGMEWSV